MKVYRERREEFLRRMGPGMAAVIPSAPQRIRNNDAHYIYRQDSDLHYLTGFEEPGTVLLLLPGGRSVLFVRPRDPEREIWDGRRAGVEGAVRDFGVDEARSIDELDDLAPRLLEGAQGIVFRLGFDEAWDRRLIGWMTRLRARARAGVVAPVAVVDPAPSLHELRLRKDGHEVETMRRAGAISGEAHVAAMRQARDGMREYELQATIEGIFRSRGGQGPAYGTIVAGGANATILHYRAGHEALRAGELCLIDAGCEYGLYASDVTRTFPVGGRWTREQQASYEVVLASQLAAIEAVRPGATMEDVHMAAVRVLCRGMIDLGLLRGDEKELLESGAWRKYYMHKTSHWLGKDVHDVGAYMVDGRPRPLEAGMVLTVEPGLYVGAADAEAPEGFRGIGIRIEDDVLVTAAGHDNLTAGIPKTVDEVSAACR